MQYNTIERTHVTLIFIVTLKIYEYNTDCSMR